MLKGHITSANERNRVNRVNSAMLKASPKLKGTSS